jgi:hypothetical protein
MIMRIPDHQLVNIKKNALSLVPADMAAEFRVIPLETDAEGGLTLAMADPTDNHAVDEVAFFADRFVVRVVATESAVRDAIERHYGLTFQHPRAADRVGAVYASAKNTATGAPRSEAPSDRPPNPSPPPSRKPEPVSKPRLDIIEEQIVLLTNIKHLDNTPLPRPAPPPAEHQYEFQVEEEPVLLTKPVPTPERRRRETLPGFAQIAVPDPPLQRLRTVERRDDIATAVLDYVGLLMRRSVFFVMKRDVLRGHDARGRDLDPRTIKNLVVNVTAPSLFHDVIATRLPYRGPLPETPSNRAFAHALGGINTEVLLMPIAVRERVIAVLYADGMAQPLPEAALHAAMREAGLAYERLILDAKQRSLREA